MMMIIIAITIIKLVTTHRKYCGISDWKRFPPAPLHCINRGNRIRTLNTIPTLTLSLILTLILNLTLIINLTKFNIGGMWARYLTFDCTELLNLEIFPLALSIALIDRTLNMIKTLTLSLTLTLILNLALILTLKFKTGGVRADSLP